MVAAAFGVNGGSKSQGGSPRQAPRDHYSAKSRRDIAIHLNHDERDNRIRRLMHDMHDTPEALGIRRDAGK